MGRRKKKSNLLKRVDKSKDFRDIHLRFYGSETCAKLDEFKARCRILSFGKNVNEKETLNSIFTELIEGYLDKKIVENSQEIILNILKPILKKAIRNDLNQIAQVVNYQSNIIQNQLKDIAVLSSLNGRLLYHLSELGIENFDDEKVRHDLKRVAKWIKTFDHVDKNFKFDSNLIDE